MAERQPTAVHTMSSGQQPGPTVQQPDVDTFTASSIPASLIPQAPSRAFTRMQSSLPVSQLRPLSPERSSAPPAIAALPDPTADRLPRRVNNINQVLGQSPGMAAGQRVSRDHAVPVIPQWVPPHPTFSRVKQSGSRSVDAGSSGPSDVRKCLFEKPSRALALKRRNAVLLYEYSRDAAGLPIPGTQRCFKLNANPRQIGQESIGLGVYLTSIIMYMVIMLLLTLLSIYLIVDNSQQKGYAETYTSYVNDITSGYCPKTWEVNNKLTDTTAGNFCAGKKYSSMYSCAADCRYTSTSLNQTICHGLPDKLSYTSGFDVVCDEHKVCGSSTNVSAPDGPCYCCTLELQTDTVEKNQVTSAQMWVLLLGQLVFLVWLLVLNKVQATAAAQINASVLTAGDYTVYVTGLSQDVTNADLTEYASHYGEVVSAANIVGAGHGLEVGRKLELLSIRQAEAHAEQALRLQKRGQLVSQRATAQPASKLAAVAMQGDGGSPSGIALVAGAGIPSDASSPQQGIHPGATLRHPPVQAASLQMTPQSDGSPGSTAGTSVSVSSQAPLAPHPRSPPPHLQPPRATRQPTNDGRPPLQKQLGISSGAGSCARRPRWWHGNLFKAFYWACVGQPGTLDRKVAEAGQQLGDIQAQEFKTTGDALITFNYERHAVNCIHDHAPGRLQQLCAFMPCVQQGRKRAPRLKGNVIAVVRAPEPTDVWWENLSVREREAWQLRLQSAAITIAVVAAGGVVQYYLAQAGEGERSRRLTYEVTYGDASTSFANTYLTAIRLRIISIFSGLFVVFMNYCITLAVRGLSFYERWHTQSEREKWHVVKLSVFYLLNSFVVPILATNLSGNASQWYTRGGLIEQAFYIQIANAILPELSDLLNPFTFLTSHIMARYAHTQPMLDLLLAPESFLLSERYASAVKTLGLAIFFMPVLPLGCVIALVGLVISYWGGKYMALRRAQKPSALGDEVTGAINLLVRLLPLVQMILMYHLFFQDHRAVYVVFWIGIAFWLLFAVLPSEKLLAMIRRNVDQGGGTGGLSFFDTIYKAATWPIEAPHQDMSAAIVATPSMSPGQGGQGGLVATISDLHHEHHTARPELYVPKVPGVCSAAYKDRILANFELPERPFPANETLLEGQAHDCGGIATRPPPQSPHTYPHTPVIRLNPLGATEQAGANAGATFGLFNPLPIPVHDIV